MGYAVDVPRSQMAKSGIESVILGRSGFDLCQHGTSSRPVPAGSNDVFTLTVHINSEVAPGTFITNTANVGGFPDDTSENDSSAATTQVPTNNADVSLTKSSPSQVHSDTDLTFTITVTNLGPNAAANVSFTDSLPGGLTFVSFNQTSGPVWDCGSPGSTTTCSIASLAANSTSIFRISAIFMSSGRRTADNLQSSTISRSTSSQMRHRTM